MVRDGFEGSRSRLDDLLILLLHNGCLDSVQHRSLYLDTMTSGGSSPHDAGCVAVFDGCECELFGAAPFLLGIDPYFLHRNSCNSVDALPPPERTSADVHNVNHPLIFLNFWRD